MGKSSEYFTYEIDMVKCKLCNYKTQRSKTGSTFKLNQHIKNNHPKEHAKIIKEKEGRQGAIQPSSENGAKQNSSIFNSFQLPENSEEAKKITRAITEMICTDLMPLSTTDRVGFRRLMKVLKPRYNVKSRWSITRTEVPRLYQELREKLQKELDSTEHVVIGFDLWSDEGSLHEVIGTIVFFMKGSEVVHRVLGAIDCKREAHTSENLSAKIKEQLNQFNIYNKVVAIVRDGAANAVKTCSFLNVPSFDCLNHKLHLAAQDGTESIIGLTRVLEKYRKLVRKFKKSAVTQREFENIQLLLDLPKLRLKKSSNVRWGYLKDMFERALTCKEAIVQLLKKDENLPQISDSDWTLMKAAVDLLSPLSDLSDKAQRRGSTASTIIPLCMFLTEKMKESDEQPEACAAIGKRMEFELQKYRCCDFLNYATLLDPRYKDLFFDDSVKESLMISIISDWNESTDAANCEIPEEGEPVKKKQKVSSSFDEFIKEKIKTYEKPVMETDRKVALRMELERYLATAPDSDIDPIKYWTGDVTKASFPLLSNAAKKYIICPPGSAEVERLFSTAGIILNKYRKSLSPETFHMMLFNSKNITLLDEK